MVVHPKLLFLWWLTCGDQAAYPKDDEQAAADIAESFLLLERAFEKAAQDCTCGTMQ